MDAPIIHSELLARIPGVVHGFTSREGGASKGAHASLNLAHRIGDEKEAVEQNRRAVLASLGRSDASFISVHQVHGDTVLEVNRQAGRSIEADGLWTRDGGAAVAVLVADCVPILLAAKNGGAVAAVHAGWRGTRARIVAGMVERLKSAGFPPEQLVAALGPAIGPCCFEIGTDVADQLRQAFPGSEDVIRTDGTRMVADLWELNQRALVATGVLAENVSRVAICTRCTNQFFSHRRDQGATGRQAGVIGFAPKS
jgi:polyphenol oxidase